MTKLSLKSILGYKDTWNNDEKLYRRFVVNSTKPFDFRHIFGSIDIESGISFNRSHYSEPNDVLTKHENIENYCNPIESKTTFKCIELLYSQLKKLEPIQLPDGSKVNITIKMSPELCNVSHCEIIFKPNLANVNSEVTNCIRSYFQNNFPNIIIH